MILLTTILLVLTTAVPFCVYLKSEKGLKNKKVAMFSNIGMFFASIVIMTVCMGGKALAAATVSPASNGMAFLSAGLATAGATIDSSVAAQTTASNISYDSVTYSVAKDSTLPEGLSLDENGRLTGSVAESGTYTFDVVMTVSYGLMQKQPDNQMDYSDSTLAKTQTFTLNVQ